MSVRPAPLQADATFPRSKGWSGQSWAYVIDYHIRRHREGSADYRLTFNDDDRLCVTCHGEGRYSVPIPKTIVSWVEEEMRLACIRPEPSHRDQLRFARGAKGTRAGIGQDPDPESLRNSFAEQLGVTPDQLTPLFGHGIENLKLDEDKPVLLRETDLGAFAFAYVTANRDRWEVHYGMLHRTIDGGLNIEDHYASRDRRNIRGGAVCDWAIHKVDEAVALHAKIRAAAHKDDEPDYSISM